MLAGCGGSAATHKPIATSSPAPQSVRTAKLSLRQFYRQHLVWRACDGSFQCSALTVPIDYRRPSGATLKIAVIRKLATGSRRGSLVVNPGGPGVSGVEFVEQAANEFSSLTDHYDLVSFDPRGVGASHPVRCLSSAQLDTYFAADPVPHSQSELAALERLDRRFVAGCVARNGSFLAHISTLDSARDMDVLRAALGDSKLTYYGGSYGTYLGAKYAQLFPTHIRAMVLDGAIDPLESAIGQDEVQGKGFEVDLDDFLSNCAAQSNCPVGATMAAGLATVKALNARIRVHPLAVGNRQLTAGTFFAGLAQALYSPTLWPTLQEGLAAAQRGDGHVMLALSDELTERNPDGSYSNAMEAELAIDCIDRPSPRSVGDYVAAARRAAKAAPVFGAPIVYGSLPCAFWPVPPVERLHAVSAQGAPPILVIGTTRDPATPYTWAKALSSQLSSGVLLTYDGDGHTAFDRGDSCVVGAVDAYIEQLEPPPAGTTCR